MKIMSCEFTFAVCAYKDSPYLEEAVRSAARQTVDAKVLVATSTPSDYIANIARKYNAEYFVNPESGKGIAADWMFALSCAKTPYAVIAHQDDVYFPEYAERVLKAFRKNPDSLIVFTDYGDLMDDGKVHKNRFYLWIKRFLLLPFYFKHALRSRFGKQSAVRFGNAISCPTVSYNLSVLGEFKFDTSYSVNLDWAMWLMLSERKGAFVFVPRSLMAHRISGEMETAAAIRDNRRFQEDFRIFERIWGKKMASFLMKFYKYACKSNN